MSQRRSSRVYLLWLARRQFERRSKHTSSAHNDADQPGGATLLGLPVEIRLQIFGLLLNETEVHVSKRSAFRHRQPRNALVVQQICRSIRWETQRDFYQRVTFSIDPSMGEKSFRSWLETIGPDAVSNLRRLQLTCDGKCAAQIIRGMCVIGSPTRGKQRTCAC